MFSVTQLVKVRAKIQTIVCLIPKPAPLLPLYKLQLILEGTYLISLSLASLSLKGMQPFVSNLEDSLCGSDSKHLTGIR